MTKYNNARVIIRQFESLRLEAYPDPLTKDEPWAIGYGSTTYADGKKVRKGDRISVDQANELLDGRMEKIEKILKGKIPYWAEMNDNQKGSLISFAFNLGEYFFGSPGFNTISTKLRNKEWNRIPEAMLLYRNPGTAVEAGLLRRRKAEGSLWVKAL